MKVFKFGGASVKTAGAVRNVADILKSFAGQKIVVVVFVFWWAIYDYGV